MVFRGSENFSDDTIGKSRVDLVDPPSLSLKGLLGALNAFADKDKLPVGVPASLAATYNCSERTVRRRFAWIKNDMRLAKNDALEKRLNECYDEMRKRINKKRDKEREDVDDGEDDSSSSSGPSSSGSKLDGDPDEENDLLNSVLEVPQVEENLSNQKKKEI